jgi:hypothetical protein
MIEHGFRALVGVLALGSSLIEVFSMTEESQVAVKEPPDDFFSAEILPAEQQRIKSIREARKDGFEVPEDAPLTGLALSGGGIRSAAFGLGVLHALQKRNVIRHIDYLSTVSGGGYTGAAWTYLEALRAKNDNDNEKSRLQLGNRWTGSKTTNADKNCYLDHIRGHGNFVTQGDQLGFGSIVAMLLRSIFVGLAIWLPLAALGLAVIVLVVAATTGDDYMLIAPLAVLPVAALKTFGVAIALAIISLMAAVSVLPCFFCRSDKPEADYKRRYFRQKGLGWLFRAALAAAILASLPYALQLIPHVVGDNVRAAEGLSLASITSALGGVAAFWAFFTQGRIKVAGFDLTRVVAAVGAALMLYAGLVLALFVADFGMRIGSWLAGAGNGADEWSRTWAHGLLVLTIVAAFSCAVMYRYDLNEIALHRLYRDRLMETFMPDPNRVGRWHMAEQAEKFWLHEASPPNGLGPYHLLNANVVLLRSNNTLSAGRGGDSFVLSPLYCGSDATGWRKTDEWMRFPSASGTDFLSLATAMAISGAAVNPNAASAGQGPTRNRFVALAMSLLNLRLGVWVPNPGKPEQARRRPTWWSPGWRILFARAHHEDQPFVELSDGGHFENLGIYELVRRKVKLIIAADASCDPQYSFADLGTALERCRLDFGADIEFSGSDFELDQLIPQDAIGHERNLRLARRGFAVARIRYSEKESEDGLLVYIKTTMTHDLPADVYAYRLADPAFPDQSTGDQWFDEAQFEAYRELGYSIVKSFLDASAEAGASDEEHKPESDPLAYAWLIKQQHDRGRWAP